jgi:hypothetical protein
MRAFFVSTWRPGLDEAAVARPLEPVAYAAALSERWPSVRIASRPPDEFYTLQFRLPSGDESGIDESGIRGELQRDETTVVFTARTKEHASEFLFWHRSYVPANIPLFFFDEGLEVVEELHPKTSRAEIEAWILRLTGPM